MAVAQSVNTDRGSAVRIELEELDPLPLPMAAMPVEQVFEWRLDNKPVVCECRSRMLRGGPIHALLFAADQAWACHRPLHLTPDAIWITITRGVAEHINQHAEELRGQFVAHSGKQTLQIMAGADLHSAEGWRSVIADFETAIQDHVGPEAIDFFRASFSTTGPTERLVSQAILMEGMKRYFSYEVLCVCGIPAVILEGTPEDWREIHRRLPQLDRLGLGWWREVIDPLLQEFVRASEGNPDVDHWRRICRVKQEAGFYGDSRFLEGWLPRFVLYVGESGKPSELNPILQDPDARYGIGDCGTQLTETPIKVMLPDGTRGGEVNLAAGLLGVSEDGRTGGLRAEAAFAILEAPLAQQVVSGLQERATLDGPPVGPGPGQSELPWLPPMLGTLYAESNGLTLKLPDEPTVLRIVPQEDLLEVRSEFSIEGGPLERETEESPWLFFGWMGETRLWCTSCWDTSGRQIPVIGVRSEGLAGRWPILASSPEEFLSRLMALHEGEQFEALGEVTIAPLES